MNLFDKYERPRLFERPLIKWTTIGLGVFLGIYGLLWVWGHLDSREFDAVVVDKSWSPSRQDLILMPQPNGTISQYWTYQAAEYRLLIAEPDGTTHTKSVSQETYGRTQIGETVKHWVMIWKQ